MKKILKYFLPYQIIFFIKRLNQFFIDVLVRFNLLFFIDKKKINSLKKVKKNHNECFIIGGGPSIKNQNLNILENKFSIVHNAFYLLRNTYSFKPSLYVLEDPLPAEDNSIELNKIKDIDIVVPLKLKKYIKNRENVTYINFDYTYIDSRETTKDNNLKFKFSDDLIKKGFWGGTVVYFSLQIAYFLGFKKIYLFGVDLSYKIPTSAKIDGSIITSTDVDNNHLHKDWFGKGKRWHFPRQDRMQIAIESAVDFLSKNGVEVYNFSPVSRIKGAKNLDFDKYFYEK